MPSCVNVITQCSYNKIIDFLFLQSEDVESSQQAILQTDRRHHVEAVAPAVHARRYSGSHRPDRGDPIQFMQPMVQGLHGHGHGHA